MSRVVDFVTLVHDVKECCAFRKGICKNCPYEYMPAPVCSLKFLAERDLQEIVSVCESREGVLKCDKFRGKLIAHNPDINRNFEADLWTIKKSIDDLYKNVDIYINGRKK